MLGQGCLRAFFGQFISTKSAFKMGFCQWAEMDPKWVFWVQKWVKSGSKPTFDPL